MADSSRTSSNVPEGTTYAAVRAAESCAALALVGLATVLVGCAGGNPAPEEPVVAPTGKVYDEGTPPEPTRHSQTAALYLRRDETERALKLALEGTEQDSANPVHYYLAGIAHARLGQYGAADSMLGRAERIYPAYELKVEPVRRSAWAKAFNAGTDAYTEGEVERAIEAWRNAILMYDLRPNAHQALGRALIRKERRGEAIDVYRAALRGLEKRPATRVLEEEEVRERREARANIERMLARLLLRADRYAEAEPLLRRRLQADSANIGVRRDLALTLDHLGREREADRLYADILAERSLDPGRLFSLGNTFFQAGAHEWAVEAFGRLTKSWPYSRDAWYNYANALLATEDWNELVTAGNRLSELDPLGENSLLIAARAHLETGNRERARRLVGRAEEAPVHIAGLRIQNSREETTVLGQAVGNEAKTGESIHLRFVFYRDADTVGSQTVAVAAPPRDERQRFSVTLAERVRGYRYEVVQPNLAEP